MDNLENNEDRRLQNPRYQNASQEIVNNFNGLSDIESNNLQFSLQVHSKIERTVPGHEHVPLVYLGSGGDLISAMVVSGSQKIILIDDSPFLTKNHNQKKTEMFNSGQEMMDASEADAQKVKVGVLHVWQEIRPGYQMIANLIKLGVNRNDINITISENGNAQLQFVLPGNDRKQFEVQYVAERVNNASELQATLTALQVSEYGIMAKGGAGEALVSMAQEWSQDQTKAPTYLVTDDPRSTAERTLTQSEEQDMYPGFNLSEVVSSEKSSWGYSWNEIPGSTKRSYQHDYKSRAVIGVKV